MAELAGGRSRQGALLRLGLLAALLIAGALSVTFTPLGDLLSREGVLRVVSWMRGSPWAPALFVCVYAAATALAMPGSVLTLAGGALFGTVWGTVYNTVAANLGANLAFAVARLLGRDGVQRLAGSRLDALDRATEAHGFRGLLTLRLIPAVPFNALNFGAGLTAVRWPTYAAATVLGIFPGTLVYTAFADALLAGSREASQAAFLRVLVLGLALLLLSFLPTLARRLGVRLPGSAAAGGARALVLAAATAASWPAAAAGQVPQDHAGLTAVLEEVVRPPSVDYAALKERRAGLDAYLAVLAATPEAELAQAPRAVRLAFWINAYNACMLKRVVDHYPIRRNTGLLSRLRNAVADRPANSVWQIEGVFTEAHCRVAGALRSQDEIEHEILRPMGEPRIHFAVNCAARSCPRLWPRAYEAATLDEQLDRSVRAFVADPEHFRIERGEGRAVLRLNRVLDWFQDDFGGIAGLRSFLAPYLDEADRRVVEDPSTRVEFFEYDWTLNDVG